LVRNSSFQIEEGKQLMKWKAIILLLLTLGIMVLVVTGCGVSGTGETATTSEKTSANTVPPFPDNTRPTPPGVISGDNRAPPSMDFTEAAAKLGVTEEELREAMEDMSQNRMDFAAVAEKLGVTEEALREAFGFSGQRPGGPGSGEPGGNGGPPPTSPLTESK
jgi:hypothetical protein